MKESADSNTYILLCVFFLFYSFQFSYIRDFTGRLTKNKIK